MIPRLQKRKNDGKAKHYDLWSSAGEEVRDGNSPCWESYPRPQMKRNSFFLLKEGWALDGENIKIPFPPQALLSGYQKEVGSHLTYDVDFCLPESFEKNRKNGRTLLHFGAVDQIAEVFLDDVFVGKHIGGYLPFSFDITDVIKGDREQEKKVHHLTVKVTDELDHTYPYGKQRKKRGGMWYTPVSGIWQSVWLEQVPNTYIKKVKLTPDLTGVDIELDIVKEVDQDASLTVTVNLGDGRFYSKKLDGMKGRLELKGQYASDGSLIIPKIWTPEEPFLYEMKIQTETDEIETYFALRTIAIEEKKGIKRVCLNGKPIFLHGVLDQGYFSDGLYLPAKEEEYEQDILRMKELGYNMLRKHIKIEPEYFYYACDKMGMLVMQDMVNSGPYSFLFDTGLPTIGFKKRKDTGIGLHGKRQQFFIKHTKETIEHLYNHPSVIAYTIFNEDWGQFQSDYMYEYAKSIDDTRLYDATSGWFAQKKNDFDSEHIYFKVIHLNVGKRPMFVSECGGYSLQVEGHYYNKEKQYGYGACQSKEELTEKIVYMYREMILPSVSQGVCGCVYTQLSDVEDEINGLYTYDRKVCKVLPDEMIVLAKDLQKELEY